MGGMNVLHPLSVTVMNDIDLMHTASMGRPFNYTSRMSSLGQYVVSAHCLASIVANNLLNNTVASEIKTQPKSFTRHRLYRQT